MGELIELKFISPHLQEDQRALLSCKNCMNKTFRLVMDKPVCFPLMECAGCGEHIGRMGWYPDDDPLLADGA